MFRVCFFITLSIFWNGTALSQVTRKDHDQIVQQNNGTIIQNNVVVNHLKAAAVKAGEDSQVWDRLLVPQNELNPSSNCDAAPPVPAGFPPEFRAKMAASALRSDSLRIYLGGGLAWCNTADCAIVTSKSRSGDDVKLLWLQRKNGTIIVNAKLFRSDGKIAVELAANHPFVNGNVIGFTKRESGSDLTVVDEYDKNLLHIRMLNKNAVVVEGVFYTPEFTNPAVVKIGKDTLFLNHNNLSQSCFGAASHSVIFISE